MRFIRGKGADVSDGGMDPGGEGTKSMTGGTNSGFWNKSPIFAGRK